MKKSVILRSSTLVALASVFAMSAANAAELKPGDVIDASNFDQVKEDTFEGHKIKDLITDKVEILIKNYNLKIPLRASEDIPVPQEDIENTKKYAGEVKIDPETKEVTGYKAGTPFPDIDVNDPLAGFKALNNYYYQNTYGNSFDGSYTFLFVDSNRGLDRAQRWWTFSLKMKGRQTGEPVLGDGTLVKKQLLFAVEPFDIKGLGIFTVRYDSKRLEDNWAYVKSVRRTRQLSGSSWMDNMAGSVQLNDEYDGLSGRPSWYPTAKLIGKRHVLAVAHLPLTLVNPSGATNAEKYPTVNTQEKPFSMPAKNVEWEPREVWAIELGMPGEHPYSKRILYMDTKFPRIYNVEHYDKSGEFAKISFVMTTPIKGDDGILSMTPRQGLCFDIKRQEGFVYLQEADAMANRRGVTENDVTLGKLEAAAK